MNQDKNNKKRGPQNRGLATREAILTAARAEFEQKGYEATRTPTIAKLAGVSESTIFLHYKSKLGLLVAVIESFYHSHFLADIRRIRSQAPPSLEQVHQLLESFVVVLHENWGLMKAFAQYVRFSDNELQSTFYELNKSYTDGYIEIFETLKSEKVLKESVNSYLLRDTLFGAVEHYALARFGSDFNLNSRQFVGNLLVMLLQGVIQSSEESLRLRSLEAKVDQLLAEN